MSLDRRNRKGMPLEKVETVPDGLRDGFLRIALDDLLSVNESDSNRGRPYAT